MHPLVESYIYNLKPYVPGMTFSEAKEKYGISDLVKLASNENCFGASPKALEAIQKAFATAHLYPIEERGDLKEKICAYLNLEKLGPDHVVLGNGSNELIMLLVHSFLAKDEILLNGWPSFLMYRTAAEIFHRQELAIPLTPDFQYDLDGLIKAANGPLRDRLKMLFIANPNNPTGRYLSQKELDGLMRAVPEHMVVVVDEAYAEFVSEKDYASAIGWVSKRPRTVVIRTFSKIFGLAGLRIGYAVCQTEIAEILHRMRDPFNVNSFAQVAAKAALGDTDHVEKTRENNQREMVNMRAGLKKIGIETTPSSGNFLLLHLEKGMPSTEQIQAGLLAKGVIVRGVTNYDLPRSLRVTIGLPEQNQRFLLAISAFLDGKNSGQSIAKSIK